MEKRDRRAGDRNSSPGLGARERPLRRGRSAHVLRAGGLCGWKGEPAASAALTLGRRRTTVPLKRRWPADRGETRVRLSGPASSLPGARAPRRVCMGRGEAWGRELEQTSKFGNASLSGVNSGLWTRLYPQPPKDGERRWGGSGGQQDLSAGRRWSGARGRGWGGGHGPGPAGSPAGGRAPPLPVEGGGASLGGR